MEKNIKTAGVSLIEVMISMVLISLLLMAVASVFPRMSSHRKGIQESDIAKIVAGEVLEGLQMLSETAPCPDFVNPATSSGLFNNKPIGAVTYKISLIAENESPCIVTSGITTVKVKVSWSKQHNIYVTGAVR